MTATAALTAQNTLGVTAIHAVPPAFVRSQIDAVVADVGVDVVKTGMLASAETARAVGAALREHFGADANPPVAIVVDPVMTATTGAELLAGGGVRAVREALLPLATVLTPNVPEARMLLSDVGGSEVDIVRDVLDLERIGRALLEQGPRWVLVKGGHVPFARDYKVARTDDERAIVVDVLVGRGGECLRMETPWKASTDTHGTGCSLACEFSRLFRVSLTLWHREPRSCV